MGVRDCRGWAAGTDILGKVLLSQGLELRELFFMEGTVLRPKQVGHLNSVLGLKRSKG